MRGERQLTLHVQPPTLMQLQARAARVLTAPARPAPASTPPLAHTAAPAPARTRTRLTPRLISVFLRLLRRTMPRPLLLHAPQRALHARARTRTRNARLAAAARHPEARHAVHTRDRARIIDQRPARAPGWLEEHVGHE